MERLSPRYYELRPLMRLGWPEWWHHQGHKMMLIELNLDKQYLKIANNEAQLSMEHYSNEIDWCVDWKIRHEHLYQRVAGSIVMNDGQIKAAFGLDDTYLPETSDWLIRRYGGTVATQGLFIRYRDFLNIPNPGTGNDGDPNISIQLNDQIKEAVKQILSQE